jgi:hypothetical protein
MNIHKGKCGIYLKFTPEVQLDAPDIIKNMIEDGYKKIDEWIEKNNKFRLGEIEQNITYDEYHQVCLYPYCKNLYINEDGDEIQDIEKCLQEHSNHVKVGWTKNIFLTCNYISKRFKKYASICRETRARTIVI